jgi:hypothetical protein
MAQELTPKFNALLDEILKNLKPCKKSKIP